MVYVLSVVLIVKVDINDNSDIIVNNISNDSNDDDNNSFLLLLLLIIFAAIIFDFLFPLLEPAPDCGGGVWVL